MAPEAFFSKEADELRALAQKVRDWQESRRLSDSALCRQFSDLGSTKTFTRILANDLSELDLERQLNNYRAVAALIDSLTDEEAPDEELYDDLHGIAQLRRAYINASRETGPARFLLIEGENGMGKTRAAKLLAAKFGSRFVLVEANEAWNDNPGALLGDVLKALGTKFIPAGQMDRLDAVLAKLNEGGRRCLVFDEGHHLGARTLNIIKTLLNRSKGEVIVAAVPTLWRRLERQAYEEARQLAGNRLAERIRLQLREGDVRKLVTRRLPALEKDAAAPVVAALMQKAPAHGNLGFVREVIKALLRDADGAITQEQAMQAIGAKLGTR